MPDNIVRVDRSVRPCYPEWVTKVRHPELEAAGPTEYDLMTIKCWLHDGQKNDIQMHGDQIYEFLKSNNMLVDCLDIRDGQEIQKKGKTIFREFFGGKSLFLWKSVVEFEGDLRVPAIPYGNEGIIWWVYLGFWWRHVDPAARFG